MIKVIVCDNTNVNMEALVIISIVVSIPVLPNVDL